MGFVGFSQLAQLRLFRYRKLGAKNLSIGQIRIPFEGLLIISITGGDAFAKSIGFNGFQDITVYKSVTFVARYLSRLLA